MWGSIKKVSPQAGRGGRCPPYEELSAGMTLLTLNSKTHRGCGIDRLSAVNFARAASTLRKRKPDRTLLSGRSVDGREHRHDRSTVFAGHKGGTVFDHGGEEVGDL